MDHRPADPTAPTQPGDLSLIPPPPPPPPPVPPPSTAAAASQPGGSLRLRLAAVVIAALIVAGAGGIGVGWGLAKLISGSGSGSTTTALAPIKTTLPPAASASPLTSQQIASRVAPAVVDIYTTIQTGTETASAAGTGLIISSSGDVLTNNHVVDGSVSISVNIEGRSGTYAADVVGVDPGADVAVIHIRDVSGLPTVKVADSSTLQIGQRVIAIGNALGLGGAPRVTEGVITGLDQSITASDNGANPEQLTGMIEADAQISPGDSGGGLVNASGQVVGMLTAGLAGDFNAQSSTVGYAIPTNNAMPIASRILSGTAGNGVFIGPVGYLGVNVQTLDSATAAQLGLSVTSGALVSSVASGSPAELAGITPNSVITAINSTTIDSAAALGNALHQFKPGDHVTVTWIFQKSSHTVSVTLATGPNI